MDSGLSQCGSPNYDPEITVLRIADVHVHEEDIPALTRKLTQQMKRENVQRDPIIVDRNTGVVLDGVHRKIALEKLGCDKTVACLVKYPNSSIKLKSWYPCVRGPFVIAVLKKLGMKSIDTQTKRPKKYVLIVTREGTFTVEKNLRNIASAFKAIQELLSRFTRMHCEIVYETEDNAFKLLERCEVDAVIPLPRLKKIAVVAAAKTGKVFGPKTTRHIIPKRPMDLRVPLDILRPETPIEVARDRVRLILSRRKKILRQGTNSGTRPYEESVYIFE